jgi:predicted GH43/DUF377 family glycosyl hydrolase
MEKRLILETKDIAPSRPRFRVLGVFNPAVTKLGAETVMIVRVAETVVQDDPDRFLVPVLSSMGGMEIVSLPNGSPDYDFSDKRLIRNHEKSYLTSISHLRVGRSRDGVHFTFPSEGILMPEGIYECYGIEDPRITKIDATYYITYTAVSDCGIGVRLMRTTDFRTFTRLGNIFSVDNKDCVLFPKRIGGKYYALHRPSLSHFGRPDIWTAESPNLIDWGNHKIMTAARTTYGDCARVGAGAVPIPTERGWLVVYHVADSRDRYHLACMLLDWKHPERVLMRSARPLLEPTEPYEKKGFVNDVVFTCGALSSGDSLNVYYGVCDQGVALCTMPLATVWETLEEVRP